MSCTCVVGLQWGDEAKGKVVDLLCGEHDAVVRYNGGANAGHTIVWGDRSFKLSLLPTGVLQPRLLSVIANGVVVDPIQFIEEIRQIRAAGLEVGANLVVSERAHVIFPYHREEERLTESTGDAPIGTTGRGIGPCYQDKAGRTCAVRVGDLLKPQSLRDKLRLIVERKNRVLAALGTDARRFDAERMAEEYVGYGEVMRPFVRDTTHLLHRAIRDGRRLLFEAAQGSLLDVDHGTYPYVTSSNSSVAGVWSGSGVPTRHLTRVIGIIKAYTTRVGRGPLPTELHDATGERIRQVGREFGTVTGRPRRVGWFDAVAARYSAELSGADSVALMLLDVLSGLPELKICTAYRYRGERLTDFPADAELLAECEPIYETVPGWDADITKARTLTELPKSARIYAERLAEATGRPLELVSVGPDRAQTIRL